MKTHLVFVYGSLRQGFGNHGLLAENNAKFIGNSTIRARLYTEHWGWPFIKFSWSNKERVVGEVYEVDRPCMNRLDQLEGYSYNRSHNLFNRKRATTDKGQIVWIYEGGESLLQRTSISAVHIKSGDWKIAKNEHYEDCKRHLTQPAHV